MPKVVVTRGGGGVGTTRRAEGVALIAFGLAGIILVVLGLGALSRLDATTEASPGEPPRPDPVAELRLTLGASEVALSEAATSSRSAGAGLVEAADAAGAAGTLMTDLAATMRGLANALRITILGAQPFAAVAPAFDALAERSSAVATDLEAVRTTVRVGADDLATLAEQLRKLGDRVGNLRESVDAASFEALEEGLDSLRLFGAALLAWLAVPAVASVWLGVGRLRPRGLPAGGGALEA